MHRMHDDAKTKSGPETTGVTIHWTWQYDIFARLMGLGVNGSNSRRIIEMAKIKSGDQILDVGCGTGDLTLTAQIYVGPTGSAHGIDAAPEGIEIARKKATRSGSVARFDVGLVEKLDFAEATFDAVISRLVIHHLPEDLKQRGFREIYRVLKPGGRVFITDFKPPTNPLLVHLTAALVGHRMMMRSQSGGSLSSMLTETGFYDVVTESNRSAFLLYVSGKRPAI